LLKFIILFVGYTVAGKAIGFALEQPLHVVTLAYPASGIQNSLGIKDKKGQQGHKGRERKLLAERKRFTSNREYLSHKITLHFERFSII
jgi:hypothetical protein